MACGFGSPSSAAQCRQTRRPAAEEVRSKRAPGVAWTGKKAKAQHFPYTREFFLDFKHLERQARANVVSRCREPVDVRKNKL